VVNVAKERKKLVIDVAAQSQASPEAVWALLSDVRTWHEWAPFKTSELEKTADGDPNGVGAIRRFGRGGGKATREVVVAYEPNRHLAYELLSGVRAHDYRADVWLSPATGGGTSISWKASFHPDVVGAGWIIKLVLGAFIRRVANELAKAAVRASVPAD
jgi:hypothetical protein